MGTFVIVIVVIVVVAAAFAAVALAVQRRRSAQLQEKFGSEYSRTMQQAGDRRAGERDLRQREKRRSEFEITPLDRADAARYRDEWAGIQRRFVDEPADAVQKADSLVVQMMRVSGYPVDDFDHRADDISVDHPDVAQHYREAHAVAVAQLDGTADTEQLRQAVTSYRELVDALLRDSDNGSRDARQS